VLGSIDLKEAAEQRLGLLGEEIGQVFGLSYSAVSDIVKDVKVGIKETPRLGSRAKRFNSQFKM